LGRRRLRVFIGLALGCALAVALFATQDLRSILGATRLVGPGFALVIAARFVAIALIALGWRQLFAAAERPSLRALLLARWVGEAVNTLLPVAQIGGDVARGRILLRWPVAGGALPVLLVVATIVVDMTLNLAGQFALAIAGAWHVWRAAGGDALQLTVTCLVAVLPLLLLAVVQRPAMLGRVQRGFSRLIGKAHDPLASTHLAAEVHAIYGRLPAFAAALILHLAAALSRAFEAWIVLRLMGAPVGVMDAIMIEGLSSALRTAAFLLPAGLGVQEGALLVLCGWIGVPPTHALALALIKRARELVMGGGGLLVWLALERPARRSQN
jgi:putative membrane protein